MEEKFTRTELLLGVEALKRLSEARVAVFGIGGVGGYVCETLVRTGHGQRIQFKSSDHRHIGNDRQEQGGGYA